MIDEKVGKLVQYYADVDISRGWHRASIEHTALGQFVPSPLLKIREALTAFIGDGVIDPDKPFFDAGSGDARIVALANILGFHSYGCEEDLELFSEGQDHLLALKVKGVVAPDLTHVMRGDFASEDTYDIADVDFRSFGTVYNFMNNERDIAHMIVRLSPKGTAFVLYGSYYPELGFSGLKHHNTILLDDDAVHNGHICHVYVK